MFNVRRFSNTFYLLKAKVILDLYVQLVKAQFPFNVPNICE